MLEESEEDPIEIEKDPSEDLMDIQEGQLESVVEVESTQPSVRRSTRLAAGHRRDVITKEGIYNNLV